MLDRWRANNPEGDEPEDDDLYDYALSQHDDIEGRFNELNETNSALADRIAEDPKLAALIAGIMEQDEEGNRRNPAYILAKLYGKDFLEDEESLNSLNEGYAEYLSGVEQTSQAGQKAQENFLESMSRVDAFAQEKGLGEEQVEELRNALVQSADDILNGVFSDELIEIVSKGLSHEADVASAADTGYVEGKNERVAMQYGQAGKGDMPAMGGTSHVPEKPEAVEPVGTGSFFDDMKDV